MKTVYRCLCKMEAIWAALFFKQESAKQLRYQSCF